MDENIEKLLTEIPFIKGQNFLLAFNDGESIRDFLASKEAMPGRFVMVHGWPHVVIDAGEQGKKIAGMRPPNKYSFVY